MSFSASEKKDGLVVGVQVGEEKKKKEVGGTYVCIFTADSYL